MAAQWLKAHLGSPLGLFFISNLCLYSRTRRYCQGPLSLSLSPFLYIGCLFAFNRLNHPIFASTVTIQLQISLSALSPSF